MCLLYVNKNCVCGERERERNIYLIYSQLFETGYSEKECRCKIKTWSKCYCWVFCLSSNICYFMILSSLRWSQLSIPGFHTKFHQNNEINLSYAYLEDSPFISSPHVYSLAHHVPLIPMLILTKANVKTTHTLYQLFMKMPHRDLLEGENTNVFWIHITCLFVSIYIYDVNIHTHSGYDLFQNPELSETKPNKKYPKCLSCIIGKTTVQAKNQTWVWVLPLLLIMKQLGISKLGEKHNERDEKCTLAG